ncbi:MAG: M14 family metallopeptidase [Bacillota bacterium]|nr:M14 family metallopeptidase [Bacillota bacterium]
MAYLLYEDLVARLEELQSQAPDMVHLEELGRSPEGRIIWGCTLSLGPKDPGEKPALLVDANVHAGEVTGSAAALYLLQKMVEEREEPDIRELLTRTTLYVIPRISVDGAEAYLKGPEWLRSARRRYPEGPLPPGWYAEDVDGDGKILWMRWEDPLGEWTIDPEDARLMRRRRPGQGGPFYRFMAEGVYRDEEGKMAASFPDLKPAPSPYGLDFNRNYPAFWQPEAQQPGAGEYPLSEPETRAVAKFIVRHTNIGAYISLHTTGGVLLRPPSAGGDDQLLPQDRRLFQTLTPYLQEQGGYPVLSTYEAFAVGDGRPLVKGADDWAYEHRGILAFTLELWDLDGRAGARGYSRGGVKALLALSQEEREEDETKRLRWNDEVLGGRGFHPWRPFDHPQLGKVELGGWERKFTLQNPPLDPPHLLEHEGRVARKLAQGLLPLLPRLAIPKALLKPLGEGENLLELQVTVANEGYLGTAITAQTQKALKLPGVQVEVALPQGWKSLSGPLRRDVGQLSGWGDGGSPSQNAVHLRWVLHGTKGAGPLRVTAFHPRGGREEVQVEEEEG